MGRAAVFLKSHDSAPYLDTLLHACTHYVHYDVQCENSRVPYLWRLIEISKRPDFFREALYQILIAGKNNPDDIAWYQVFDLARHFAQRGDGEMRQAMYAAFGELGFENAANSSAIQLVLLDGIEGLLFAAGLFDIASPEREIWEFDVVVQCLEEKFGKDVAKAEMAKTALSDTKFAQLLEAVEKHRREWERSSSKVDEEARLDYVALKARPVDRTWSIDFSAWARTASPVELEMVARDLLVETDETRLPCMLRIFSHKPFPVSPDGLLTLADDDRVKIRNCAVGALRNVTHPSVRRRALELLKSANRFDDGMDLLVSNYEPGDFTLIWDVLPRATDLDAIHGMSFALESMNDKFSDQEAEKLLLWLYEKNPCSMCRAGYVHGLQTMGRLPDWMREEYSYDADESTLKGLTDAAISSKAS